MMDNSRVIDAIRGAIESGSSRINVRSIKIMADGNYRADGTLSMRQTMFNRVWLVSADLSAVTEL